MHDRLPLLPVHGCQVLQTKLRIVHSHVIILDGFIEHINALSGKILIDGAQTSEQRALARQLMHTSLVSATFTRLIQFLLHKY